MKIIKESIVVNANLETTFKAAETYPLFVKSYKEREIIYSDSEKSEIKAGAYFFGVPVIWEGKGVKLHNQKIKWVQTRGLLQGLVAEWIFTNHNGDTEISICAEYDGKGCKGRYLAMLTPLLVPGTLKKILHSLKETVEDGSWTSLK